MSGSTPEAWSREDWTELARRMLVSVRPHASAHHARVLLPGRPGGYGSDIDGLEGFARTFLLAGFLLAGENGRDPLGLAEWYAQGLAAGTDPGHPERWPLLTEHGQAKVEAASLALILDLTRPWIWDRLDDTTRARIVAYLSPAVGDTTYPQINWIWFRLVVQTFLRSVGGPHALHEMAEDLRTHDSFVRADGWLSDGPERAFDHYTGWALHLYPVLWARMRGAHDLAPDRAAGDVDRLDRYLVDLVDLVGGDGSPLMQGRSLVYRFAAAAPFWVGAVAGTSRVPPGQLRRAAGKVVRHFVSRGAPDERGLLTLGWHREWRPMAQHYSGTGSPYWASLGLLGLSLPPEHPVWQAPEEPLPNELADRVRAIRAPGWVVATTRADGIVRIANHGTDHALPGERRADSPLYARIGYSTATFPIHDDQAPLSPSDQTVALVDADGRTSHRSGLRPLAVGTSGSGAATVGIAASEVRAHWMRTENEPDGDAGIVVGVSLVRGPWEVRLVRVAEIAERVVALRISGWPVTAAADRPPLTTVEGARLVVRDKRLVSTVVSLDGTLSPGHVTSHHVSPLGEVTVTPYVMGRPTPGRWYVTALGLWGTPAPVDGASPPRVEWGGADPHEVLIGWPDDVSTVTPLPRTPSDPGVDD
ncbi:DUF2264 domain-containing protein [Streptomyces sp. NBRC 109706]|uniref:DUF2264 domain-containing protein n=1 Tax=Streptomyces sp. NBRC 109706 TaxID=1550035 RepID=UPI0007823D67|nr:DUF2264 domain-containing protein [Streptomyces sp. NBRC 109706]